MVPLVSTKPLPYRWQAALRASPAVPLPSLAPAHPSAISWSSHCTPHSFLLDTGVVDRYFTKLVSLAICQL
ncbi:hypothetical protein I79_006227 [Cricetulus griseus]|uniref:Uncharacterized protein n=1 Tax=Cricetulus griseus TaxID=10029 RepID=G3H798_CRIGR|nr:hypothetical protein I79_006227 [Cricetulus griseus]